MEVIVGEWEYQPTPIRTAPVRALVDEFRAIGHELNPLLDAHYSLGGFYPVTDFTPVLGEWLAHGLIDEIADLWNQITSDHAAHRSTLSAAMAARVPREFGFDRETENELRAVHLLGSRLALYEFGHNAVPHAIGNIFATRLASIEWTIAPAVADQLCDAAEREALIIPELHPAGRKREMACAAMAAVRATFAEADRNVALWMQQIPPMSRLVIADYFQRGERRLRPVLYYGDRKYGCCGAINQRWIDWVACFEPPGDEAEAPHGLTKKHLREALDRAAISSPKSATREELLTLVRQRAGLLRAIFAEHLPEHCIPRPEWEVPLRDWASRCEDLRPLALAVLKPLILESAGLHQRRLQQDEARFAEESEEIKRAAAAEICAAFDALTPEQQTEIREELRRLNDE